MPKREIKVGNRFIGEGHPCFIIGEIGLNHNGSVSIAKKIISGAKAAGCDAVKFQKRTPEICTPKDQWNIERDTPWGRMKYIDYRHRVEFGRKEYSEINKHCNKLGILWFASCWDEEALDFMVSFDRPLYKTASASLTDLNLLKAHKKIKKPVLMSTGMSTVQQIAKAVQVFGTKNLLLAHATSSYPAKNKELNLRMIETLQKKYLSTPIGYSGHEVGLAPTWAAVTLGASFVERHITLDRAMWGTDQAASVEIGGLQRLISNIRDIEQSLGDGIKKVYDSEIPVMNKLRRIK